MKAITSQLNHTFTVYRKERVDDGQGGWEESLVELATVAGRLRPASASERIVAQQEQRQLTHVLYTAGDVDVQRGDVVVGAGVEVEVQGVREPSRAGHHLEIDCIEIQWERGEEGS